MNLRESVYLSESGTMMVSAADNESTFCNESAAVRVSGAGSESAAATGFFSAAGESVAAVVSGVEKNASNATLRLASIPNEVTAAKHVSKVGNHIFDNRLFISSPQRYG